MPIVHIVLFEFKPTAAHAQVVEVCENMISLQHKCIHPTRKEPYVKSYGGGRDTSPEGLQVGAFTHGFVCEFSGEEDRRYYLEEDPAHLDFVKSIESLIQNVRVVDYEPGKY